MTPRLSGHFSIFGLVFFVLKSLLRISRQWSREKFAILSLKPRSHVRILIGSLRNSVFERLTSTGGGIFALLGSGLVETLGYIVFIGEKKLSNTNVLASRQKALLPVDGRRSKMLLLKLPDTQYRTWAIAKRIISTVKTHDWEPAFSRISLNRFLLKW